ncbi:imidazole glycerol phosphate synthase subunit HisH [Corynebacterium glucuronolyticum]|uniref:imidazole glycerol phosphate synthase subunit HisH n=1 Tax=Corynebacterium glucuronolyticum TaxID=39791 RepID=UPI0021B03E47|nr:imidazole glycerol phosphate synthase subunit HisH [Corynebacterium glucuronolyticum]MCT1441184.1 imidazole glycerol phosphate synthase subunit HisH [Corynebacterium glucuronolyticum]
MVRPSVAIVDYGAGNLFSAARALEEVGASVSVTDRPSLSTDGVLIPGVGAFASAMEGLRSVSAARMVEERLAGGRSVLGICLGLQVMFDSGVENDVTTRGLAQWPGTVESLGVTPLPHMGWNTVERDASSRMFAGISPNERFYFVHSYGVLEDNFDRTPPFSAPLIGWTEHAGRRFISAVEDGPLWATQFHPEKSGRAGLRLLSNWVDSL